MRRILLVRHGRPDFPLGTRRCLGRTDLPLGALGRMQACRTARWLGDLHFEAVYSSPLKRAAQTAGFFSQEVRMLPALREMDCGDWDGLDFEEIRRRWPEVYTARGRDLSIPMPNGEAADAVRTRAEGALRQILSETAGDVLIVAHSFVIRTLLGDLGLRLPYASVSALGEPDAVGLTPDLPPEAELADALLTAAAPGERIEAHCRAVAQQALRIARCLPAELDLPGLAFAALLHDVARAQPHHAQTGAEWVRELGYPRAAALIAQHHNHSGAALDEAAILFLADKTVQEDRIVPLAERFQKSLEKCHTPEARRAHAERCSAAAALRDRINTLCGTEVIQ